MIACVTLMVDCWVARVDVEPEGGKLLGLLLILLLPLITYFLWKEIPWRRFFLSVSESEKTDSQLSLSLKGEPEFHPIVLYLRMINYSDRTVDIQAPVVVFKRWRSIRKFRIRKVNESEIYPMLLDSNLSHELTIQLEPFYRKEPILRTATKVRVEVEEVGGKRRLKSRFVRLKWI